MLLFVGLREKGMFAHTRATLSHACACVRAYVSGICPGRGPGLALLVCSLREADRLTGLGSWRAGVGSRWGGQGAI